MDRKHTVHHRCNGQPHSHEHSRNPHDQKSSTAFSSFLPVFLSLMFYRSTRVRKNILAPRTIATVILCFGVCKVTLKSSFQIRLILKIKFFLSLSLAGNRYHWHLQNTGLSPHMVATWLWADHREIPKAPISLSWTRKCVYRVPYCYSIQHRAYKIQVNNTPGEALSPKELV